MRVIKLESNRTAEFIKYCKKYADEHDPSFLSDEDLREFELDENNPTYILIDKKDKIVGVGSLILPQSYRENKRGRFRILHTEHPSLEAYELLLEPFMRYTEEIDNIYLFIPENKKSIGDICENLGFRIQRYSWVMKKLSDKADNPIFPKGYQLKSFRFGQDEQIWCDILNICFAHLAGHLDSTPDRIAEFENSEYYLEDGMMMLYDNNKAVGIVRVSLEDEEPQKDSYLDHLAVLPEYQRKGLGRNLLRAGVQLSKKYGLKYTWLTVNAENNKAAELYTNEGFDKEEVIICYNKKL